MKKTALLAFLFLASPLAAQELPPPCEQPSKEQEAKAAQAKLGALLEVLIAQAAWTDQLRQQVAGQRDAVYAAIKPVLVNLSVEDGIEFAKHMTDGNALFANGVDKAISGEELRRSSVARWGIAYKAIESFSWPEALAAAQEGLSIGFISALRFSESEAAYSQASLSFLAAGFYYLKASGQLPTMP